MEFENINKVEKTSFSRFQLSNRIALTFVNKLYSQSEYDFLVWYLENDLGSISRYIGMSVYDFFKKIACFEVLRVSAKIIHEELRTFVCSNYTFFNFTAICKLYRTSNLIHLRSCVVIIVKVNDFIYLFTDFTNKNWQSKQY